MENKYDIVIVGAGISGATLAERYASLGKKVLVIESRDHIGGNCYDFINEDGILVAKYGPHYFHTNYEDVWRYVNRFSEWVPFEARAVSHIDGKKVSLPINIKTINQVFGLEIKEKEEMEKWVKENTEPKRHPRNSEDAAIGRVGKILYEKVFKEYTRKQWDKDPKELDPEVTNRIPIRLNDDDRYFTDVHQAIPREGYAKLFKNMLSNENIEVRLNTKWEDEKDRITYREKLFFTGRIDSYFKKKFGLLEYRSLKFEFETFNREYFQEYVQENYPSLKVPFTRIVEYKHMTGQKHPKTTVSREYPTWEGEPYYPVPSTKNRKIYVKYQHEAKRLEKKNIYFVGRLANYKYFNMDQAFKNALDLFYRLEGKKERGSGMTVRLAGGMGNQMFQYALGRKLSIKNNVPLYLDLTFLNHRVKLPEFLRPHFVFHDLKLDVFNIKADIANPAQIGFWNRPFLSGKIMILIDAILRKLALFPGWEKSFSFNKKILDLGPGTYLEGYWQSEKYFKDISETLRKDFSLKAPLSGKAAELYKEIRNCASLCIFVRRKDMADKSFHGTVPIEYYRAGIEYIKKRQPIEKIYVFSDDNEWCRQNLKFEYPTLIAEKECSGKKWEGHLILMSAGRNFIIANSTFSWWSAWLSDNPNKIVVAPKQWFGNNRLDDSDLIPESWVRL